MIGLRSGYGWLLVAVLLSGGCATTLSRGVQAYDDGCYVDALDQLQKLEPERSSHGERELTRYALYRGLTHLALGDQEQAQRWMAEAKARWDADRWLLDGAEAGRLLSGWEQLGHESGAWGAQQLQAQGLSLGQTR